jgi:hypothetical protein
MSFRKIDLPRYQGRGMNENSVTAGRPVGGSRFAIVIRHKTEERTVESALAPDRVSQLALEAHARGMNVGELIDALLAATLERDLFHLLLDSERVQEPQKLVFNEIRILPGLRRPQ